MCSAGNIPPLPKCFSHLLQFGNHPNSLPREEHPLTTPLPTEKDCTVVTVNNHEIDRLSNENFNCGNSSEQPTAYTAGFVHNKDSGCSSEVDNYRVSLKVGETGISSTSENDSFLKCDANIINTDTSCFELESDSAIFTQKQSVHILKNPDTLKELASQSIPTLKTGMLEPSSPFTKLNCSLSTLQKEMKDLRFMDISIFCQLTSLHESIQDFKLSNADRYSETGSEYSLGTASYMGSMSSLNEESDWMDEGPSEDGYRRDSFSAECPSASNLLQQITALALRVDEDF